MVVRAITPQIAERLGVEGGRGVVVQEVGPGSFADSAGLRAGDLIQEVLVRRGEDVFSARRCARGN